MGCRSSRSTPVSTGSPTRPSARSSGARFTAHAVAAGQVWISTLAIHRDDPEAAEFARVNLAGFAAAGGRVLYGTDLGNGDQPVGVNPDEVAALDRAGVRGAALIASLADPWPFADPPPGVCTFVPGPPPAEFDGDRRVAARRGRRPHRGAHP